MTSGRITESEFEECDGYPLDTDSSENEYLVPNNFAAQLHRQRCVNLTHQNIRQEFRLVLAEADTVAVQERLRLDQIKEHRWQQAELKFNAEIESEIHCTNHSSHWADC
jgi:hypothetical protein